MANNVPSIVVIGGGAAGLTAAFTLVTQFGNSVKVTVVEASERLGGRVKEDNTLIKGHDIEVGAEFIHGDRCIIMEMAEQQGWNCQLVFTWAQGDGGPSSEPTPDGFIGYYYLAKEQRLLRYDSQDPDLIHLHEVLGRLGERPAVSANTDRRTLDQYLRDQHVSERVLGLADAGYANTLGGAMDTMPISLVERFERAWNGPDGDHSGLHDTADYRMKPSFKLLIDHLAKGAGTILTRWPADSVTVQDSSDSAPPVIVRAVDGREIRADRVIVAVPITVLQQQILTFSPPLSSRKSEAMGSMKMANGMKAVLVFSEPAWPADCQGAVSADAFVPEMWMNQGTLGGPTAADEPGSQTLHYVSAFFMNERANTAATMEPGQLFERILQQLQAMFGGNPKAAYLYGRRYVWGEEPYIRGAYMSVQVNELPLARAIMAEPHANVVFFAGDATSGACDSSYDAELGHLFASPLVLHGAMQTGMRAAQEAMHSLGLNQVEQQQHKPPMAQATRPAVELSPLPHSRL